MTTRYILTLNLINACLIVGTGAMAIWLWRMGEVSVGTVAMALPLAWQISNMAGWVGDNVTTIFENVGVVQEGMDSIARPLGQPDRPGAPALQVTQGEIRFEQLSFAYSAGRPVLQDINLTIRPGERIGLVGRSGAGKSTLVHLLLRFFEPSSGRILIDGQDTAACSQDSVRAQIGMVTQDTSLLHRSVADNIAYGRPGASRARVLLKDAPILVLDEATSALDSEVEQAIQAQLLDLMQGKTVIAIAHRLSTIARMDRLLVLDQGRIVEAGSHAELLAQGGLYADLWRRQTGGFLAAQ
jgi:ATP-binding cassette subfamily B multidrug efflux pump